MTTRILATVVMTIGLLSSLPVTPSLASSESTPAASYYDIFCGEVGAREGYQECTNARGIAPNQFLRIYLVSAGRKTVRFRAYNVDGDHELGETGNMTEGGDRELIWRNDTGRNIVVVMKVDLQGLTGQVNVNARVHVTTF